MYYDVIGLQKQIVVHIPIIFSIFMLFVAFVCRQFNVKKKEDKTLKRLYTGTSRKKNKKSRERRDKKNLAKKLFRLCNGIFVENYYC